MRYLALDIGKRRTGVAYLDDATGIPLPLDTIMSKKVAELVESVVKLAVERKVDRVIVGLPRLPSGAEGEQAAYVRDIARILSERGMEVVFVDERYTTPRTDRNNEKGQETAVSTDKDSAAACEILRSYRRS